MENKTKGDMTTGSPAKHIIRFSLPLLAGNVLQQMYNVVDSIVIGNFAGKEALAAVGNSFIINFLLVSLFMGIGLGATIIISQSFGAKNYKKVQATADTMYVIMIAGSLAVSVIGILIARPILRLINTPEGATLEMSVLYLQTIFIGSIGSFGYNVNSSILQGIGDSKSSLLFLAIATIVNTILDLLFVAVFNMGVFGAALATIIAQTISFVYGIIHINRHVHVLHIGRPSLKKYDNRIMMRSISLGLPAGVQNMLFCLGTIALQRLVNSYGAGFMAGYNAAAKIDSFAFLPITSLSAAVTTYAGQNIGAGNIPRVKKGVKTTCIISFGLCLCISALVLSTGRYLLMIFSRDAEVIETGVEYLNRIMPPYFLLSLLFVVNSALRGTGQTIVPLVSVVISLIGVRVPAAYILNHYFGKYEMFWCFGIGWVVGLAIALGYYISGRWQKASLLPNQQQNDMNKV